MNTLKPLKPCSTCAVDAATPTRRIRTLIVDDSALVRKAVTELLARDPEIEVVGTAMDPYVARDRIVELEPDVITLDLEMPRMDGLTFLRALMRHRPMPVVVMSSLTAEGSAKALEALEAGAVEVIGKPRGALSVHGDGRIAETIKAAALANVRNAMPFPRPPSAGAAALIHRAAPIAGAPPRRPQMRAADPRGLILLGASTGGTEALGRVLGALPADVPPICIVQHIAPHFSEAFAKRLHQLCAMEVREARPGDRLERGLALVAPGGFHLTVRWVGSHYVAGVTAGPTVHHQRPAVDVLFDSAARAGAGPHSVGALLTGMGKDGAAGLLSLRQAGASTIAQNEGTCVVFGMPREAIRLGAAEQVLPLDEVAEALLMARTAPSNVLGASCVAA